MEEDLYSVSGANVLWSDHDFFCKAFHENTGEEPSRSQVDDWLVRSFAKLTWPHMVDNEVHLAPKATGGKPRVLGLLTTVGLG